MNRPRIAIVVGMQAEGRIANVGRDLTIIGGGSAAQVEARLTTAMNLAKAQRPPAARRREFRRGGRAGLQPASRRHRPVAFRPFRVGRLALPSRLGQPSFAPASAGAQGRAGRRRCAGGDAGGQAQAAQQEWRAGGGYGVAWRGAFREGAQPAFRGPARHRRSAASRLARRSAGRA